MKYRPLHSEGEPTVRSGGPKGAGQAIGRWLANPLAAGLVVCLVLLTGALAITLWRKASGLEEDLAKTRRENEELTKALAKVTLERDDLVKEKEDLGKQLAGAFPPPEALGQMITGLLGGMGAAGGGAAAPSGGATKPLEMYMPSGSRVRISDGGAPAFYARQGGMPAMPGAGFPQSQALMEQAQAMSRMAEAAQQQQMETERRAFEAERGTWSGTPSSSKRITSKGKGKAKTNVVQQPTEPLSLEEAEKRWLAATVEKQAGILSFQIGLSQEQEKKTSDALKKEAAGLFAFERPPDLGGPGDGKHASAADQAAAYGRSSDALASKMKEILSPDQYATFEKWRKRRDMEFDAAMASFTASADEPDAGDGGAGSSP